jgi:hypothetical protein
VRGREAGERERGGQAGLDEAEAARGDGELSEQLGRTEGEEDESGPRRGADGGQRREQRRVIEDLTAHAAGERGFPAPTDGSENPVALAHEPGGQVAHRGCTSAYAVADALDGPSDPPQRAVESQHQRPDGRTAPRRAPCGTGAPRRPRHLRGPPWTSRSRRAARSPPRTSRGCAWRGAAATRGQRSTPPGERPSRGARPAPTRRGCATSRRSRATSALRGRARRPSLTSTQSCGPAGGRRAEQPRHARARPRHRPDAQVRPRSGRPPAGAPARRPGPRPRTAAAMPRAPGSDGTKARYPVAERSRAAGQSSLRRSRDQRCPLVSGPLCPVPCVRRSPGSPAFAPRPHSRHSPRGGVDARRDRRNPAGLHRVADVASAAAAAGHHGPASRPPRHGWPFRSPPLAGRRRRGGEGAPGRRCQPLRAASLCKPGLRGRQVADREAPGLPRK